MALSRAPAKGGFVSEPPVRDVVLFETPSIWFDSRRVEPPPISVRVELAAGICIAPFRESLDRKIRHACTFRGYRWKPRTDALPTLYAFVRETDDALPWDSDGELALAVALSRVCHSTSIGLELAARVFAPGVRHPSDYVVEPGMITGHANQAYIADPAERDWLTVRDVEALPRMIANFARASERVQRALWFHEYAARTEHVPVRLTLLVAGIEALEVIS